MKSACGNAFIRVYCSLIIVITDCFTCSRNMRQSMLNEPNCGLSFVLD